MSIFVKDTHFELINEHIKPDAKKGLSLGSAAARAGVAYNINRNQIGQIMLDPVKTVPVYETKLYQNKQPLLKLNAVSPNQRPVAPRNVALHNLRPGGLIKLDERYH